jgi:hypothetical protein
MLVIWLEIVQTGSEARMLVTTFLERLRNDDSVVVMLLIARWRYVIPNISILTNNCLRDIATNARAERGSRW